MSLPETKRRAHLYDGIDFALRYLENARNPNRALLVVFSNDDVASDIDAKTVKAKILSAHIPTYVVSLYSRTPDDFAPTQYELTRVAIDSGGDIWEVQRFNKLPHVMAGVRLLITCWTRIRRNNAVLQRSTHWICGGVQALRTVG